MFYPPGAGGHNHLLRAESVPGIKNFTISRISGLFGNLSRVPLRSQGRENHACEHGGS
jgi:hypothetical protein